MKEGGMPIKIDELCELFGWTKNAVYTGVHRNKIPAYKIDGTGELWFFPAEIIEKIKSGRLNPNRKRRVLNKSEKETAS